jgi:hypothetical protein
MPRRKSSVISMTNSELEKYLNRHRENIGDKIKSQSNLKTFIKSPKGFFNILFKHGMTPKKYVIKEENSMNDILKTIKQTGGKKPKTNVISKK